MTTCDQGLVGDKIPLTGKVVPNDVTRSNQSNAASQSTQVENATMWEGSSTESGNEMKTSLIVNYLPQSVKESDFTNLFAMIGPLKSAKLMYDRDSGYSFGYGFIDYVNPADALRAIDTYNGYRIEHKRLKVAFSRPNTEETRNTTLYIRNLPSFYDDAALVNLIRPFGEIVQARVIRNPTTGNPRGIAFVIMSTKKEATGVIQALNGQIPSGGSHPLVVKFTDQDSNKRKNKPSIGRQAHNFRSSANQSPVSPFTMGSNYTMPPVDNSWTMLLQDNSNRLQEWLLSANQPPADDQSLVLQYMAYLEGQPLTQFSPPPFPGVVPFIPRPLFGKTRSPQGDGNVIYVYGLRPFATDQELRDLFSPFGQVNRVDVVMDSKTNKAKGFGFVTMENHHEAMLAVQSLNGRPFNGRNLQVRFRN